MKLQLSGMDFYRLMNAVDHINSCGLNQQHFAGLEIEIPFSQSMEAMLPSMIAGVVGAVAANTFLKVRDTPASYSHARARGEASTTPEAQE